MRIGRRSTITAAARRIKYAPGRKLKVVEQAWEERAWNVYDRLPEIHYGVSIRSGIAERFDYFAARRPDPQSEPQRIGLDLDDTPITPADRAVLELLDAEGGPALIRRLVTELVPHFDVVGRAYLVAFGDDDEREWRVLSTMELRKKADGSIRMVDADGDDGDEIDRDRVFTVWRPHPRKSTEPDSPVRASLEVAEQLILLNREMRARSYSRLNAGIFAIPDTMDFDDDNDEDDPMLSFEQELTDRITRPIKDAGSAASVAPWVITGDSEDIADMRHITFDRDWDVSRDDREELIRRLANGLDLPPEILLGMADVNHWTAWQVNESAVTQHVDPTVREILDSLTMGWFLPMVEAAGIDATGVVLWRDLSPAIVPADQADQHFTALSTGLIGFDAARERLGYDESEAPDLDELELIAWLAGRGDPSKGGPVEVGEGNERRPAREPEEEGPPAPTPPAASIVAATITNPATVDATALADLDAVTLDYVLGQCEAGIDRVIEKAGARMRSQVQGTPAAKTLSHVPNHELGRHHRFADGDIIDPDDLSGVLSRIRARLSRVQDRARRIITDLLGISDPGRTDIDDNNLDAGLDQLEAAMMAAASTALYTPGGDPDPIDVGEVRDRRVPTAEVRAALSVAGGGAAQHDPSGPGSGTWELVANGKTTHDTIRRAGAASLDFTWRYGDPAARVTQFDPHRRLDGIVFTEWDDPRLLQGPDGAWVGGTHYRPGDHRGCLCNYTRTIRLPVTTSVAASAAHVHVP